MLGCLPGALPGQKRRKSNQMECATTSLSQQVHDREVTLKLNRTRTPTRQILLCCYSERAFEVILLREQHTELTVVSFFDDENNQQSSQR